MTHSQESLQEPEVQFVSVVPALETEHNVSDNRSITDCKRNKGQPDGNHKQHMASTPESKRQDNLKLAKTMIRKITIPQIQQV